MRTAGSTLLLLALGVCTILQFCRSEGQGHLDSALYHYDTLHVDHLKHTLPTGTSYTPHTSTSAHQLKREVEFYVLEKKFHLHLLPHRGIFSKDFAAYVVDASGRQTSHHVNFDEFYRGFLHDEETAIVVAHLSRDGILSASIKTSSEIYHIEPSENYIKTPHSYHMIAYRGSDVKRKSESKIDYVRRPLILESDEDTEADFESSNARHDTPEFDKSSYRSNHGDSDSWSETSPSHIRLKRQSDLRGALRGRNCRMILVADYTFFQRFVTEASTVRTLVTLVSAIDAQIYRPTEWIVGTDDAISGFGLEIGSVLVHTAPFTTNLNEAPTQFYNSEVLSARNPSAGDLLDAFNFGDWRDYCLAHLFTFRDFDSGLLGLANIASPRQGETGGICSGSFIISGRRINYNTGISTFSSDGNSLVMEEARLVTGHELGHNWGSHHDPQECGDDFLMNEFAQDGSLETHMQFSSCSRRSIGLVLLTKGDCFGASVAVCGDFRQEPGEQCDAGPAGDACCTNITCMRRPEANCSDSNDDCCVGCLPANTSTVCRFVGSTSLDCTISTLCDGVGSSCPPAQAAAPNSSCIGGLCVRDEFTAQTVCTPLCTALGRTSCSCTGAEECLVCCRDDEDNCVPAVVNDMSSVSLSNGAACSNGACLNGSCTDQFQPQDTITRLFDIITNLDINELGRLVSENIVGCVLFFTASIWIPVSCVIHFICDHGKSRDYTDWIPRRIHPLPHREREREPLLENEEPPPTDKPEFVPEPVDDQPLPSSYSGRHAIDDPPSYIEKPPIEHAASSIDEPLTRTYI